VSQPVPTVTTKDRFGLIEPAHMDILFRMLTPGELALAQGFSEGYRFQGSKADQIRQIGNAVPPGVAQALTTAVVAA
jgi:DNA (cytosine-5)-methyltransferase 1